MSEIHYEWSFSGPGGNRTVVAKDEQEARHLAMVDRWGPPTAWDKDHGTDEDGKYLSQGLFLLEKRQMITKELERKKR